MHSDMPKKMIIPCIINVLKNYTDESHTLTQEEIGKRLESDYAMKVNRKTLSRNLKNVMAYDERIRCSILKRNGEEFSDGEDEEGAIYTNFYFEHMFEKSEIQALVYNVIFSKHISSVHKREIVKKLESLGPFSVRHDLKHYIRDDRDSAKEFSHLFWNLEEIDRAVAEKKVVEFQYAFYEEDLMLHISERVWKGFPFGIAVRNNDYYLVGLICGSRCEPRENLISDIQKLIENSERGSRFLDTFRIDLIRNLVITENEELMDSERKRIKTLTLNTLNSEWGNIQDYVSQNRSLSSGRNITAKFMMINGWDGNISDAIDYFSKENVSIEKVDTGYLFKVKTNDRSMMEFAKTFAREVEVLEPPYLRNEMRNIFREAYEKMSCTEKNTKG